jgi:hypothetical protein
MGSWNAPRAHHFRKILQRLAATAGFHIGRMPPNRFEATEDVLKALKQHAFNPQLIIDAGANVGDWTRFARTLFPAAGFVSLGSRRRDGRLRVGDAVLFEATATSSPTWRGLDFVNQ